MGPMSDVSLARNSSVPLARSDQPVIGRPDRERRSLRWREVPAGAIPGGAVQCVTGTGSTGDPRHRKQGAARPEPRSGNLRSHPRPGREDLDPAFVDREPPGPASRGRHPGPASGARPDAACNRQGAQRCAADDSTFLERLAILAKEPVALLETYLSARAYPGLLDLSFADQSLYEIVAGTLRYGRHLGGKRHRRHAVYLLAEAEKLDVPVGEPLLRLEGTAFAEPKQPVEYFRVLYRANRVRFHLESRRRTDGVVRLLTPEEDGTRTTLNARPGVTASELHDA